ncbi:hypothetical protein RB5225 [Rhodopirellula baltica SH 1]|uniref:Uncharacterized protein n=1 Tax=Rhodopirellula baltica (strain DSM 10527 / NCIMB 13988 / SH1) TaxID=243090 RepID=Q7UGH0_RHOBA|nr:hypothetical protein RB5225 [Rhodopirellula baltica SH 1]
MAMHSPVNRFANSIRTTCPSLTRFEVAFYPRMANGLVQHSQGIAPGAEKHASTLANGQIQFKTFGLMLAIGQPISLRSRSLGRCPRLR